MPLFDDPVVRVRAHTCAGLSNFFEKANEHIGTQYVQILIPKLMGIVNSGRTVLMENAITCLSSVCESCKAEFAPFYPDAIKTLTEKLVEPMEPCFRQFKGQLIEAITIVSVTVGEEVFRPFADHVIQALLTVQKN